MGRGDALRFLWVGPLGVHMGVGKWKWTTHGAECGQEASGSSTPGGPGEKQQRGRGGSMAQTHLDVQG